MSMPEATPPADMSLRDLAQFAEGQARRLAANFGFDPTDREWPRRLRARADGQARRGSGRAPGGGSRRARVPAQGKGGPVQQGHSRRGARGRHGVRRSSRGHLRRRSRPGRWEQDRAARGAQPSGRNHWITGTLPERAANRQPAPLRQHGPPAFREGGQKAAMIANDFLIRKDCCTYTIIILRHDKRLRDHAQARRIRWPLRDVSAARWTWDETSQLRDLPPAPIGVGGVDGRFWSGRRKGSRDARAGAAAEGVGATAGWWGWRGGGGGGVRGSGVRGGGVRGWSRGGVSRGCGRPRCA